MKTKTLALPTWNDTVSAAFDFARELLVVSIQGSRETGRQAVPFDDKLLPLRVAKLGDLNVDVLICGCISQAAAAMVSQYNIEVVSHVCGSVDDIIAAYLAGKLVAPRFCLPGFGCRHRHGRGGRCGRGRGRS